MVISGRHRQVFAASPAPRSAVPAADVATSVPLTGVTGTGAGGAGG